MHEDLSDDESDDENIIKGNLSIIYDFDQEICHMSINEVIIDQ